ncbi:Clavaminate synthase-like protein [Thozetella sp. PMI_491]|nr:Clavaminate synthase-like protein [Thozetella sp. PMI_491]
MATTTLTRAPEEALDETTLGPDVFPVIDFGNLQSDPEGTAAEIFDAACRWGFLVLRNHGISTEDVQEMFATSQDFFNQPAEVKREKWMNTLQQGYDYKESVIGVQEGFCFGGPADANLTCDNLSSWWTAEKRQQAEDFRAKCQMLSQRLLETFSIAMGLPKGFFSKAHDTSKVPGNVLRLIKYPALSAPADPSFPRLGEHTDWGTLTLLFATTPGLEVRPPGDQGWVPAPVIKDAVIVNIADGLALWSGKTLKSTLHRLSWDSLPYNVSRFSIAYFVNANADAPLHFLERTAAAGGGSSYTEAALPFSATFGDYQAVRMRIIHEKFDTNGTEDELKLDPSFVEMVRNIGVAHGTGVNFEGKGVGE